MRSDFYNLPYAARMAIQNGENQQARARRDRNSAAYWRNAYEMLVKQTGRDLNDGLGLDPRKAPATPATTTTTKGEGDGGEHG